MSSPMPERLYRELRRLALAGKREQVHARLQAWLQEHPDDEAMQAECRRLEQGEPLRLTESPGRKRQRELLEQEQCLLAGLQAYQEDKGCLGQWDKARVEGQYALCRSPLPEMSPDRKRALKGYRLSLRQELKRRRRPFLRRLVWGGCALSGGLLVAGCVLFFQQEALKDEAQLSIALKKRDGAAILQSLRTADTGANALFCPSIRQTLGQARQWLHQQELELRQACTALGEMEEGKRPSAAKDLAQRAAWERRIRRLSWQDSSLAQRWKALLDREESLLSYAKAPVLHALSAPLPPFPVMTGEGEEDLRLLAQQREQLEALEALFDETSQRFSLSEEVVAPIRQRVREIAAWQEEIHAYRKAVARLPQAKTYSHYRAVLADLRPTLYRPACELAQLRDRLPDEASLQHRMQEHGGRLPDGMLEDIRRTLQEGGPTFSPRYPATMEQEHTMDDVFVSVPLRQVFYELSHPAYGVALSEAPPVVDEEGVHFTRSRYDEGFRADAPLQCSWKPGAFQVMMRKIDPTGLLKASGIRPEDFFSATHLPSLLSRIANFRQSSCPALAQAYLYDRVLTVMLQHPTQELLGMDYAPSLRGDIRSFVALRDKLRYPLEGGCWLRCTPQAKQAEEAYSRWFREHSPRHYDREIARHFKALTSILPRYAGYVDGRGHPCLLRPVREGTPLWYVSQGHVRLSPAGKELDAPQPYSPVFVMQKSF